MFKKWPFPATIQTLASCIGLLGEGRPRPNVIELYVGGLKSLCIDCALDLSELDVYSHPVLHRIITGIKRFRGERETRKRQKITSDILLYLLLQFETKILESVNLQAAFCLGFESILRIEKFTYVDRSKYNFGTYN